jgi:hypothetical protein
MTKLYVFDLQTPKFESHYKIVIAENLLQAADFAKIDISNVKAGVARQFYFDWEPYWTWSEYELTKGFKEEGGYSE